MLRNSKTRVNISRIRLLMIQKAEYTRGLEKLSVHMLVNHMVGVLEFDESLYTTFPLFLLTSLERAAPME